jgi:hypothetical protein
MASNSRDSERIQILGELNGDIMVFEPMVIKEISRGGALVETRFALYVDSLHDLRLTLGDRSVVVKGRVAHCRISDVDQDVVTYHAGMEFVDPPDHVRAVVLEFLESIKNGRKAV